MESAQRSATVFAITGMSPLTWTFMYGGRVAVEACSHLGDVLGCVSHGRLHRDGIKDLCLSSFYWRWPHPPVCRHYLDPFAGICGEPSADNATTRKRNSVRAVFSNDS